MNRPKAVFLDKDSLGHEDLDFTALEAVADWESAVLSGSDSLKNILKDVDVVVTNKIILDEETINDCENLKLICVAATGVNNVDVEAAKRMGISVSNVTAYATVSVVQHVFSMILSLNQKLASYQNAVRDGSWSASQNFCYFGETITELNGKTIGIIGYGDLGRAVAEVARVFGMQVLIAKRDDTDERQGRVNLETLLSDSDVVSLHCPLTENNYHMIAEKQFSMMKADAILINTARGGLIDEDALLKALKDHRIAAAAIDVLETEPPSKDHALIRYLENNLIITPHIAWASRESRQRLVDELAKNIHAFMHGDIRNAV